MHTSTALIAARLLGKERIANGINLRASEIFKEFAIILLFFRIFVLVFINKRAAGEPLTPAA
jgi:hypothetical protein